MQSLYFCADFQTSHSLQIEILNSCKQELRHYLNKILIRTCDSSQNRLKITALSECNRQLQLSRESISTTLNGCRDLSFSLISWTTETSLFWIEDIRNMAEISLASSPVHVYLQSGVWKIISRNIYILTILFLIRRSLTLKRRAFLSMVFT